MISSLQNNSIIPTNDAVFQALGGNALAFGNAFSQAMDQAKTPADKAKVAWLQAEYGVLTDLNNLGNGSSSLAGLMGLGSSDLGSIFGLPSWAADVQRLLGSDSNVGQAITAQQQMAFTLQSQFNQSLASFGSTGSSFNSLI
ncbi:MAG TPA: hypothetical protein VHE12_01255 [bacterium]|nr:hypothetical protein [bacterium]